MKKFLNVIPRSALLCCFLFFTIVVAACSFSDDEHQNLYRQAQTVAQLEVPDDLAQPVQSKAMDVPENLDKGEIAENLELPPPLEGFVLEEDEEEKEKEEDKADVEESKDKIETEISYASDNTQALQVKAPVDDVWPLVANAVQKIGFKIEDSNRGKNYYSISRTIEKAKVIEDLKKAPEVEFETPKEQYLVYVEPADEATKITIRNLRGAIEGSRIANDVLLQIKSHIQ